MTEQRIRIASDDDRGIGLIEVVVSMFMLALLAMAFLPLLIQGMQTSVRTSTVTTATRLVSQQLEEARSLGTDCSTIAGFASAAVAPVDDPAGIRLTIDRDSGTCPTGTGAYPATIEVTATVTDPDGAELATASTLLLVEQD